MSNTRARPRLSNAIVSWPGRGARGTPNRQKYEGDEVRLVAMLMNRYIMVGY